MPYLPTQNCLFIHIPKNAGKSIEEAFLKSDGISPHSGRRSLLNRAATGLQRKSKRPEPDRYLLGTLDVTLTAQHLTYAEIALLDLLPHPVMENATRFCVCRNPYDRAVSSVLHFSSTHLLADEAATRTTEFERSLSIWLDTPAQDHNQLAHKRTQSAFILDTHGKPAVDNVLRYENLGEDFSNFVQKIGHPELDLGWNGKAARSRDYRDYFTQKARAIVEHYYGADLEQFGYVYDA